MELHFWLLTRCRGFGRVLSIHCLVQRQRQAKAVQHLQARRFTSRGAFSVQVSGTNTLFSELPKSVRLVEVGPRDGLQNEQQKIPTETKIRFINMLTEAGLQSVEATSYVSPKAVPQLADAAEVIQGITQRPGVRYPVLVPNMKGLERALDDGVAEVAVFAAATDTFSRRNIRCSITESLDRYEAVVTRARDAGMTVRGYISCVVGCPYEGEVKPEGVAEIGRRLRDMGCYEVSLGDTIGVGTPRKLHDLLQECQKQGLPKSELAVHLHDTYGQALANLTIALQMGISVIDSSISGLGGCPFAPGSTGNVATEDCLYLLDGLGIKHGVNKAKLEEASAFILGALGKELSSSRAGRAAKAARAISAAAA